MRITLALVSAALAVPAAGQVTADFSQPTFDRWNYPFYNVAVDPNVGPIPNVTRGAREVATTFSGENSSFPPTFFDDRDAQFLNSFVTAGNFAPGLGSENYQITNATVTATVIGGTFDYDNVRNNGSSIELFGTGFRNGLNAFAYGEEFAYGFGAPTDEDVRFAYATDAAGGSRRDVSNELRDGFTSNAFAIGQIAGEVPGVVSGNGQTITFDLDLSNPDVVAYLQDSLNEGIASFTISSLHTVVQGDSSGSPAFSTKEGLGGATFSITAKIIPAPASASLIGFAGLIASRRRR